MLARRRIALAVTLAGGILMFTPGPSLRGDAAAPAAALAQLAWLSGDWETGTDAAYSEEHWTRPAGNLMLGVSRTLVGGKTRSFEFMRIEARPDGIFYVAQPGGRPGVDFKMARSSWQEVVFDNPGHGDHLTHITYRKSADGSMTARIEGANNGTPFAEDYSYRAMPRR